MKSGLVWIALGGAALYYAYTRGWGAMVGLCPSGSTLGQDMLPVCIDDCTGHAVGQSGLLPADINPGPKCANPSRPLTGPGSFAYIAPVAKNVPALNLLTDKTPAPPPPDIMVTNAPASFSKATFGMSGVRNYIRRGTPMRTR
jgi:hypothetical protein